jgi:putative component of toxin-antitoxin plasmid stabilization module
VQILEYLDAAGDSPYRDWFESLNAQAAAKVTVALMRIELGNLSNVKGVGAGAQGSRNSGSISGQDTGSTSAGTVTGS